MDSDNSIIAKSYLIVHLMWRFCKDPITEFLSLKPYPRTPYSNMVDQGFKRKLAAILSVVVEGYSRLMDDDEEATVRTLKIGRAHV